MAEKEKQMAFLVGNGINRTAHTGGPSWKQLLTKLAENCDRVVDLENEFKPFPLLYEEILHRTEGEFNVKLKELKDSISKIFTEAPPSDLHEKLVKAGLNHILTTNYDYSLEKVINPEFSNRKGETQRDSTDETLNSLRRRSIFTSKQLPEAFPVRELSIWHIHGEIRQRLSPSKRESTSEANSIMIGYEHYGDYLAEIQKYIKGERRSGLDRITERVQSENFQIKSWVDFFFFGELHIAGFSFDFSENHLWWLLNYRAKLLSKGDLKPYEASEIIYYYHRTVDVFPNDPVKYIAELQNRKMSKARLDLFEALGVKTVEIEIPLDKYSEFYTKVFERIENK
jgi:hypothetical protein